MLTPNPNGCNSTLTSGTNNIYPTPIWILMIGVTAYELPTRGGGGGQQANLHSIDVRGRLNSLGLEPF